MTITSRTCEELTAIPGVGKSIAKDLRDIGIYCVADLKGKDPQMLYCKSNKSVGCIQDKCLLYVFRCAVYFAEGGREAEKLKWWNWKNTRLISGAKTRPFEPRRKSS